MDKHDQITEDNLNRTCSTHGGGLNGVLQLERSNYEQCIKIFDWKILRDRSAWINMIKLPGIT